MAAVTTLPSHVSSDGFQIHPPTPKTLRPTGFEAVTFVESSEDEVASPSPVKAIRKRKRTPSPPADPVANALAQILDIVPDIDVAHVEYLIAVREESAGLEGLVEAVLALIFEKPYPKSKESKGKGKQSEKALEAIEKSLDEDVDETGELVDTGRNYLSKVWRQEERTGKGYLTNALQGLEQLFDRVPSSFIRSTYFANDLLYTRAYFVIKEASQNPLVPYIQLAHPRTKNKGKGKAVSFSDSKAAESSRNVDAEALVGLDELEREKEWLAAVLQKQAAVKDETKRRETEHQRALDAGECFPCGCCFGDETWDNAVQCSEGHLFCKDCAKQYAEGKIGDQITSIVCMDASDCKATFPDSELMRILARKVVELYHRLKQAKEIEDAALAGLESCPNCPWACVIEDEGEKLFRCGNEACGQITCRKCHRPDHIPKTCEEMEAERKLDSRHAVEEAMSEALMRRCPKCDKPFIKEEGCNKITCTNCRALSCYLCRQVITGYDHFGSNGTGSGDKKCVLWNPVSTHAGEVTTAREEAQARIRAEAAAEGVQLDDADLNVELPAGPLAPRPPAARNAFPPGYVPHGGLPGQVPAARPARAAPPDFMQELAPLGLDRRYLAPIPRGHIPPPEPMVGREYFALLRVQPEPQHRQEAQVELQLFPMQHQQQPMARQQHQPARAQAMRANAHQPVRRQAPAAVQPEPAAPQGAPLQLTQQQVQAAEQVRRTREEQAQQRRLRAAQMRADLHARGLADAQRRADERQAAVAAVAGLARARAGQQELAPASEAAAFVPEAVGQAAVPARPPRAVARDLRQTWQFLAGPPPEAGPSTQGRPAAPAVPAPVIRAKRSVQFVHDSDSDQAAEQQQTRARRSGRA